MADFLFRQGESLSFFGIGTHYHRRWGSSSLLVTIRNGVTLSERTNTVFAPIGNGSSYTTKKQTR